MWEMQQLRGRASATDVDLIIIESARVDDVARRLPKGLMRENMVNVRGPRQAGCPDLAAFRW